MSRATRAKRGRGASAAGRMPGRIIHWDLEAELNRLEEQGELQQDQEAGLRQADQQNQSMPWPSAGRQPVTQQRRPVPRQGRPQIDQGIAQPRQPVQGQRGIRGQVGAAGPDFKDAEVRAAIAYMSSIFKVPMLDPESPDLWVENVRDSLDASGMSAVFVAADCRNRIEVPGRVCLEVEAIDRWKMEFAWSHVRRPSICTQYFREVGTLQVP